MQSEMGIGIIGDNQTEITPFQRQVFEAEKAREARAKEERMNEVQDGSAGGGRKRNAMGGSGGGPTSSRSETVRYESEGERDDEVLEVI